MTSHDVVARVRKILRQKSVGHTGTLDPLATGLLVMVLGDATKLSDYLIAEDKSYDVKARFGLTTDTLDRDGQILRQTPCDLAAGEILEAARRLEGSFDWPVPLFSATKIGGQKLCDLGRAGKDVDLPIKTMNFANVELIEGSGTRASFRLSCSKGSFVRTWVDQLGRILGVGAIVDELRRTRVGGWSVRQALGLEELENKLAGEGHGNGESAALGAAFVPMGQALPGLKAVMAGPREVRLVGNGQIPRDIENRLIYEQKLAYDTGRSIFVKVVSEAGDLLAILAAEPGQGLKIRRVFRSFA
jgi:tRNA pseudouridine55 synthase